MTEQDSRYLENYVIYKQSLTTFRSCVMQYCLQVYSIVFAYNKQANKHLSRQTHIALKYASEQANRHRIATLS